MQKTVDQAIGLKFLFSTAIATFSLGLPVSAQSPSSVIAQAPSRCRLVKENANVYSDRNVDQRFVVDRKLRGTEVELVRFPDPTSNFAQINLNPPRYIESRNLQMCGTPLPPITPSPTPGSSSACRVVNGKLAGAIEVVREPNTNSIVITQANPRQQVFVTQFSDGRTVIVEREGRRWVQLDLQRSFGRNFGLNPPVGWMFNSEIGSPFSNLVNCP